MGLFSYMDPLVNMLTNKNQSEDQKWGKFLDPGGLFGAKANSNYTGPSANAMKAEQFPIDLSIYGNPNVPNYAGPNQQPAPMQNMKSSYTGMLNNKGY